MNFGGIEFSSSMGGMELVNEPCSSLPQELATAISAVNSTPLLGATWTPLWWLGTQLVNGTNYILLVKEVRITKNMSQSIVLMKINVPLKDDGSHASIVEITEEAQMGEELKLVFENGTRGICGASYKPLAYVGHQLVHGVNHYFICEAKRAVLNAVPYLALVGVNVLDGKETLVSIEPVGDKKAEGKSLNAPLGEWP